MKFIGTDTDINFNEIKLSTALCDVGLLQSMGDLTGEEAEAGNKLESAKKTMQTNEYISGELIDYYKIIVEAINRRENPDE